MFRQLAPQQDSYKREIKLEESKPEKQIKIVHTSTLSKIEQILILLLRFISYYSIFVSKEDEKSEFSLSRMGYLVTATVIFSFINFFQDHTRRSKPVVDELINNKGVKDQKIQAIISSPFTVTKSVKNETMQWTIGEKKLHNHITHMIDTIDDLKKTGMTDLPPRPYQFRFFRKILPHFTANYDMPSKARLLDFFVYPGIWAGRYLSTLLAIQNETAATIFTTFYAALHWLASVRESYLLKNFELQLNLEGFSYKYQNYFSFPPTCIGTQVTRQIAFNTENTNMRSLLQYIREGENKLRKIMLDDSTDTAIRDKLNNFEFICKRK